MFYIETEAEYECEEQGWGLEHIGQSRTERGQYQKTSGSELYLKGGGLLPLHHRVAPYASIWTRKE